MVTVVCNPHVESLPTPISIVSTYHIEVIKICLLSHRIGIVTYLIKILTVHKRVISLSFEETM